MTFEFQVRDTARPFNQYSLPGLEGKRVHPTVQYVPHPLSAKTVDGIGIKTEDGPSRLERADGEGGAPEFRLPKPIRRTEVEELRVNLSRRGSVHAAECSWRDAPLEVDLASTAVVFKDLELDADAANVLALRLTGPLGEEMSVRVDLLTDCTPPELTVIPRYVDPTHCRVTAWKDIDLVLEASHALLEPPTVKILRKQLVAKPTGGSGKTYELRLVGLAPLEPEDGYLSSTVEAKDGYVPFTVEAKDQAGNAPKGISIQGPKAMPDKIPINTAGPEVDPIPKQDGKGYLVLRENSVRFWIRDLHGVDPGDASVRVSQGAERDARDVELLPSKDGKDFYDIHLDFLPDACTGQIDMEVRDKLGLPTKGSWRFRFQRETRWESGFEWRGMAWVKYTTRDERVLYISKYEVSNALFNDPVLLRTLKDWPKYWGRGSKCPYPAYRDAAGKPDRGDDLPVVGVSPAQAEACALLVFHGRLPTWEEWLDAAWKENRGGKYPWEDVEAASVLCNCMEVSKGTDSPLGAHLHSSAGGSPSGRFLKVQFDPFAGLEDKVQRALEYRGEILHLIGNVGELVKVDGGHAVAGGHWDSNYASIDLKGRPRRYTLPNAMIGFRVIIDPKDPGAHPEFLAKARGSDGGRKR